MTRTTWIGRTPATAALLMLGVLIALGPFVAPYSPTEAHGVPFQAPSLGHLLGTDFVGRDVLARVLHGGYRLVAFTSIALVLSYALGVAVGLAAGMRRRADGWLMRPVDAMIVLPWFLVVAVIATAVGKGPAAIVLATALVIAPWVARIVRTTTIELLSTGFVESARARGESDRQIALRQILPNLQPVLIADAGIRVSATVGIITASSFLGLGTHQPAPDWALMVTENRAGIGAAPLSVLVPAGLITALVVSLNLVADRLTTPRPDRMAAPRPDRMAAPRPSHDRGGGAPGLTVTDADGTTILDGVELALPAGRSIALVGPSGAGKTTLALALLDALPAGLTRRGNPWPGKDPALRMGYVPQDPATGLNPALRVQTHFREIQRAHRTGGPGEVADALRSVELPTDRQFLRRYPHQLSGGQQQRVLIALALLSRPEVVVLDEPTTGLDAETAATLVATLRTLRTTTATTFVLVTHDLDTVDELVDDVITLRNGTIVDDHPDRPAVRVAPATAVRPPEPVLRVENLVARYRDGTELELPDLTLGSGECVALVGRSGSGKTTLARCLVGLHPPHRGRIRWRDVELASTARRRTPGQRRAIQLVFQNPRRSLNPRCTVEQELCRPLRLGSDRSATEASAEAAGLLRLVGLGPEVLQRKTPQLSGGQAQRVALARAIASRPEILVCDEVTSSLDPESRDGVLQVLAQLAATGVAVLFISHDDTAMGRLADRVIRLPLRADLGETAGPDIEHETAQGLVPGDERAGFDAPQ
ncbi:ATP-binding cassette domain-containing protein [Mycobacterium sp. SMC-4]|uniref:ABC transporter ATP-binding protein/permease n=1 Tax=Mycobacterium sp. SMC-4 TaxID=2857059 RepID=UPI0021B3E3B6|nr:ATP-binding cassette domain-containing protein [Mycobacterium sp. SMC-4]UXA16772.1 ATP-binding cassette domain-containing protein [Mycobacterium sp. SMC-4]